MLADIHFIKVFLSPRIDSIDCKVLNMDGKLSDFMVGRIFFPLLNYSYNRKNIWLHYRNLLQSQWYSQDHIQAIQLKKLKNVIAYTHRHVPFYSQRFKEIGLNPGDIKSLEDIKLIPPLGRQDLIDHYQDLVDNRRRSSLVVSEKFSRPPGAPLPMAFLRKNRLVYNRSSGSTGAPTKFFEDGSVSALNWAQEMRIKSWYGVQPGAKEARMMGSVSFYKSHTKTNWIRKHLWHQLRLPGIDPEDHDFQRAYEELLKFQPQVLFGITHALVGLARYLEKNELSLFGYRPRLVITWATAIFDHEEHLLERIFQCPVSSIYSGREVGHISAKCPNGKFHINQENLLVESIKEEDPEVGEIIVTTLNEFVMPFIRYRMGDIGQLEHTACQCGRSLKVMSRLKGRSVEEFVTKDGRHIFPDFWCVMFMSEKIPQAVNRFQIIYKKNKDVHVRIEKGYKFSEETEEYIFSEMEKKFSPETHWAIEYVPLIKPQISGKYQIVINEARQLSQ